MSRIQQKADNMKSYLLALGSNVTFDGLTPAELVGSSVDALGELGTVTANSQIYRTPAFPLESGADYANAAVIVQSSLSPNALLGALQRMETETGRKRKQRWGSRTLDIDIIGQNTAILPNQEAFLRWSSLPFAQQLTETPTDLILPHPRLQDRAFVLVPLAQIAPDWRHPVFGKTVLEMLAALPEADRASVVPW